MMTDVVSRSRVGSAAVILWGGLLVLGLIGAAAIWSATWLGPGLGSDSAVYVAGGQNLATGHGLTWRTGPDTYRLSIHPPFYSAALAAFELLGVGAVAGSRLLGILAMAATAILAGWLVFQMTRSAVISLLIAGLLIGTADMVRTYSSALTEGFYIALFLASLCLTYRYLQKPTWHRLLVLALCASLLPLTKYAGLSAVAALGVVIALVKGKTRSTKVRHLLAYTAVALAPFALWTIGNVWQEGSGTGRPLTWNSVAPEVVKNATTLLARWLFPLDASQSILGGVRTRYLALAAAVSLVAAGVLSVRRWRASLRSGVGMDPSEALTVVAVAAGWAYLAFHAMAILASSPQPDTNERTLLPLLPIMLLVAGWLIGEAWKRGRLVGRIAVLALCAFIIWDRPVVSYRTTEELAQLGSGYSSVYWRDSEVAARLREIPGQIVYTDDEGAVFFLADRFPYSLPSKWNDEGSERAQYPKELARMRERLRDGGLLVLFNPSPRLPQYPPYEELSSGLQEIFASDSGGIYAWPR